MAKRVVIAGAGGFGRGVVSWLRGSLSHLAREGVDEVVFIDDRSPRVRLDAPVIGTIAGYQPQNGDEVLCAVAKPTERRRIVKLLADRNANFHTFVDDRAIIASNVEIGVGSIVCPGAVISADVRIDSHVHVNFNCSVGHDAVIGHFSTLSPAANVMGEVVLGEETFLGGGATVLPRLSLGSNVILGAGSVVVRDTEPNVTVVGIPGAPLSERGTP